MKYVYTPTYIFYYGTLVISGESAGKSIDDLLIEADKIINETLPYFQTTSEPNKCKTSTDFESTKVNTRIETTQPKPEKTIQKRFLILKIILRVLMFQSNIR